LAQKTKPKIKVKSNPVEKIPAVKKSGFAPKNVCVMYRPDTPEAIRQSNELAVWLGEQGFTVFSALNQDLKKPAHKLTPAKVSELDWVIVLGGDGTYLGAVRMLEGRQIPILGVNMGSLGFLTEIRIEDLYKAIIGTLQHKMEFKVRSMLSVQVKRAGKLAHEYVALNDAVIERGSNTHLINIEVFNETQLVAAVKADALVVATPTGSTAYNLAAGGPILHPDVHAIVMTPVCPHALTSRPLIFPDDQKLSFKLVTQDKRVVLTVDGVNRGEITHNDEIVITRSKVDHFVIRKPSSNYFTLLREKLAFGQRN
jgi:NAD+ kinase